MDLGLKGRNAVVTGGSKGIGRSIALALADEGANVATCARGAGPLEEVGEDIRARGVTAFTQACDVGDAAALDTFLEAARDALGGVDILVNNVSALALAEGLEDWNASFAVDMMATVRASEKVADWMVAAGGGCILNVASISGLAATASPDYAYAAMKSAVISYSRKLAVNRAADRIRVNSLAPGSIEFEGGFWASVRDEHREMYDQVLSSIPWGRMGRPEEVGAAAAFLCSEAASWVTGACLVVDGGQRH